MFEGTDSMLNIESVTNLPRHRIYLRKIPTVITKTLIVYTARNAQVAASLLLPSRYQDAFASLAPA